MAMAPPPAEFLRTNEREAIEAWRAQLQAGIEDPAQRAELAAFCDDLLKLPTTDDSEDVAFWVKMSIDGVCPVSDPGWCVEQWRKLAHDPIRSAGEG